MFWFEEDIKKHVFDELEDQVQKHEDWQSVPKAERIELYLLLVDRAELKAWINEFDTFDIFWNYYLEGLNTVQHQLGAFSKIKDDFIKDLEKTFFNDFDEVFQKRRIANGYMSWIEDEKQWVDIS